MRYSLRGLGAGNPFAEHLVARGADGAQISQALGMQPGLAMLTKRSSWPKVIHRGSHACAARTWAGAQCANVRKDARASNHGFRQRQEKPPSVGGRGRTGETLVEV